MSAEGDLSYWRDTLAGAPTRLELPTDRPRPSVQSQHRATEVFALPDGLVDRLAAVAEAEDATLAMTLGAGLVVLLNRYTGQEDVLVASRLRENFVVMRSRLTQGLDFRALLRDVRDRTLQAQDHGDLPFERVVAEFVPEPSPSHAPLCQVVFAFEDSREGSVAASGQRCDVALIFSREDGPGPVEGSFVYSEDLFEAATIQRLCGHYQTILEAIARDPSQAVATLPMLTDGERERLLREWNETRREYPGTCVHGLFEAQVARTPDARAVSFEGHGLTYRELSQRANQLAHHLRNKGIGPEVLVGVCLERCTELVIALLAVWKAGGAYVPLDPSLPKERLSFMLKDAGAKVLLTDVARRHLFLSEDPDTVCIDSEWPLIATESTDDLDSGAVSSNLAYVMYTSGSTGQPKGVMILHRGLVNYLSWASEVYAAASGAAVPVHSSIAFDLTVTALYAPLVVGGRIELLREDVGGQSLVTALQKDEDRALVKITPAHLALLSEQLGAERVAGRSRLFVIGGENLLADSLLLWRDRAPSTRLINEYGPTETVVGCCVYEVHAEDTRTGSVPIGRPIANTQLYVLDKHMNPLPAGIMGELYIGGAGVARGYLNRPELTNERFVPDPFSNEQGARLYKSGDLARYRADGILEYLGRVDNQVKVRGYRIELGEIEVNLADLSGVKACAVLAREDTPGNKQLVGYVVLSSSNRVTADELRRSLGESLPDYMIPSHFVFLDAMPLTTNGKADRSALTAPSYETAASGEGRVPPRTPIEKKLVAIWKELLGVEDIGPADNFFDLGGHSLQAIKAVSKIQEVFQVDLSPQALFDDPTVAGLARVVSEMTGAGVYAEVRSGPFFFGEPPLFAVYHSPQSETPRDIAVLVCAPIGHEHTRSHRAVQQLCDAAARAGFPALRFDYTGVGDSAGTLDSVAVDVWCSDVLRAADELLARSGARELHVVGIRLGAAIAASALNRHKSGMSRAVKTLSVWDPVLSGAEHLALGLRFQERFLRDPNRFSEETIKRRSAERRADDLLLGYSFPEANRRAIEQLDLRRADGWPLVPIRGILSEPSTAWQETMTRLRSAGRLVDSESVDGAAGAWEDYAQHEKVLRAGPVVASIVDGLPRSRS